MMQPTPEQEPALAAVPDAPAADHAETVRELRAQIAELRAEVQRTIAELNKELASWETIKDFAMLSQDFTEAAGEMTPSLKVKRKVVIDKYRDVIEGLYSVRRGE